VDLVVDGHRRARPAAEVGQRPLRVDCEWPLAPSRGQRRPQTRRVADAAVHALDECVQREPRVRVDRQHAQLGVGQIVAAAQVRDQIEQQDRPGFRTPLAPGYPGRASQRVDPRA
jgi:hypothetical protein